MRYSLKSIVMIALTLAIILSTACASVSRTLPSVAPAPPMAESKSAGTAFLSPGSGAAGAGDTAADDRKIVKTGSITMEVADISKSLDDIAALALQFNGYVVSSNQYADVDTPNGRISIRVPANKYEEAFKKIKSIALKVPYENTSSQDVTEQYMDLKAQLKNLEATEAQYLELLKKAENVKDMLEVQRELSNVRASIERTKARIQYIERTSDMSLIEVSLKKTNPIGQSTWDIGGIFKSAVDGLIILGKVLLSILIWLLVFSPVWIIILVIVFVVLRRKRNKAKAAPQK